MILSFSSPDAGLFFLRRWVACDDTCSASQALALAPLCARHVPQRSEMQSACSAAKGAVLGLRRNNARGMAAYLKAGRPLAASACVIDNDGVPIIHLRSQSCNHEAVWWSRGGGAIVPSRFLQAAQHHEWDQCY